MRARSLSRIIYPTVFLDGIKFAEILESFARCSAIKISGGKVTLPLRDGFALLGVSDSSAPLPFNLRAWPRQQLPPHFDCAAGSLVVDYRESSPSPLTFEKRG